MPASIGSLPVVSFDYTRQGPGLYPGLKQLRAMLDTPRGREGYVVVNVTVAGAVIPTVLARSDLYVVGFRCAGNWFSFDDAQWPFSETVTKLGYNGQYRSLGGLAGRLTAGAIDGIARLASISHRPQWKDALRTLLLVVSECSRLIPVEMAILGLLNGISPSVSLAELAGYIQNWDKASKGADMSREMRPNFRTGFRDPTIIKR